MKANTRTLSNFTPVENPRRRSKITRVTPLLSKIIIQLYQSVSLQIEPAELSHAVTELNKVIDEIEYSARSFWKKDTVNECEIFFFLALFQNLEDRGFGTYSVALVDFKNKYTEYYHSANFGRLMAEAYKLGIISDSFDIKDRRKKYIIIN